MWINRGGEKLAITDLTLRVLLLFFPGIICAILVDMLTTHHERSTATFLVNSFVLGITCYLTLYATSYALHLLASWWRLPFTFEIVFFDLLLDKDKRLPWIEIFSAAGAAIPLGFLITCVAEHKVVYRIAHRIGVTRKFGDLDVWGFLFNSPDIQWIVVRDIQNDLAFEGWVRAFSDTVDKAELILRDVRVYRNSTGDFLYEVGGVYLFRKVDGIIIELADLGYRNRVNSADKEGLRNAG